MDKAKPRTEQGPVRSLGKAMELVELLRQAGRPLSLQELCLRSGYPKSTAHALLSTLRNYGVLTQTPEGRYGLGIRLYEWGTAVADTWDVTRAARPRLEELAARTGATAFLSLLDGDGAITFDRCVPGTGAGLQVMVELGVRLPLHATAQGKLLLSGLTAAQRQQRLSDPLPACTPHTLTDPKVLEKALEQVREQGYAVEDGEYKVGLRAAAAPVYDRTGQLRYALGVVGFFRRVWEPEFREAAMETVRQAALLSRDLGWT